MILSNNYSAYLRLSSLFEPEEYGSEKHYKAIAALKQALDNQSTRTLIQNGNFCGELGPVSQKDLTRFSTVSPFNAKIRINNTHVRDTSISIEFSFLDQHLELRYVDHPDQYYFAPRLIGKFDRFGMLEHARLIAIDIFHEGSPTSSHENIHRQDILSH